MSNSADLNSSLQGPSAVTVNPNAWREGLSEGISHLSFSPAFAQKISKRVSITAII